MAEYADGSMIVDTEVDTEGFMKDSEKLKKAIASFSKQVDSIGQQMKTAIARNNAAAFETLNQKLTETQGQAEALRGKLEGFSRVKVLSDEYIKTTAEIEKTDVAMKRLLERQEKLKAMGADQSSIQWQNNQKAIEETTAKLDDYKRRLVEAKEDLAFMNSPEQRAEAHAEGPEGWAVYTEELARLKQQIIDDQGQVDKLTEALDKLTTRQEQLKASGADQGSRQYQSLLYDMEQLRQKQEELNAARDKMESDGTAFKMGDTTQEFEQLSQQMSQAEQNMEQVKQTKEQAFTAPSASGLMDSLSGIANGALKVAGRLAKMAGNGVLSFLRKLASGAKNAAIQLMKLSGNAIASGIKHIGSSARKAASELGKLSRKTISSGFKQIGKMASTAGKSILGLGKNARKSNGGLKAGLKAVLRYGLGVRSMYALINKLRNAVVDAFGNMAKKVPEVNATLSKLASSLDQVKNSLATAFQPILTAIAPYLIQFMDMLSGALTKVGEFFAALTGQQYVYKATKAQIDYAKSLDKTSKSAKEAENQLAKFDDLDILQDKSKEDKEETPTSDFEKIPVESQVSDFAKRLRNAFNSGDFYGIGKLIAEKLNELIDGIDFPALGKKIGQWINHIVDLINGFFDNFDWVELGKKLADGFMALIDEVDWYELGRAVTQKFAALIKLLWGFVTNIDWVEVGRDLGRFLQGAFDNIPWEMLADLIAKSIMGVFTAIYEAAKEFDWEKAGKRIAKSLRIMIKGIDINTVYKAFRTVLIGILKFITPILKDKETWTKISSDFSEFLNKFFQDKKLWSNVRAALNAGIMSALAGLSEFIDKFEFGKNGKAFGEEIGKMIDDLPDNLGEDLAKAISGALEFAMNAFLNPQTITSAASKFATWVNGIFQDKKLWDDVGAFLALTFESIILWFQTFFDGFEPDKAAESIRSGLNTLGEKMPGIAQSFWNLVKTAFSKTGSFVDALFSKPIDNEKMSDDEIMYAMQFNEKSIGAKIGERLREVLTGKNGIPWDEIAHTVWEGAKAAFATAGDFITSLLNVTDDDIDAAGGDKASAIGRKIGEKISDAIGHIKWEDYASVFSKMVIDLFNIINGFFQAISTDKIITKDGRSISKLQDAIERFFGNIDWGGIAQSILESAWNAFKGLGEALIGAIMEGFRGSPMTVEDMASDPTMVESWDFPKMEKKDGWGRENYLASKGVGLADSIVDGAVGELEKRKSDVDNAMTATFMDQYEKIEGTSGYDIGSPSKRTEKLGKYVVKGFTNGLGESDTADAMDKSLINPYETNVEGKEGFDVGSDKSRRTYDLGENITESFVRGLEWLQNSISQRVQNVFVNFNKSIVDTIGKNDWQAVGTSITTGIQTGINSGWTWLQSTVQTLAQNMLQAAKNALGIHSPSSVFRDEVGMMLGLGTAEGYEKSQPKILQAVNGVADAMAAEMDKAKLTADLGVKRGGITDELDGVLSTFSDKVSNSFADLMNRLESIADSVTFRLPAVVTGDMMPYSVTARSEGSSAAISEALIASNEEQNSIIIQSFNQQTVALVRAIEQYSGVDVHIGDDVIGKASARYFNRMARMTGKLPFML